MTNDQRPPEPRTVDCGDPEQLRAVAKELDVRPELVTEAVAAVGVNRTAIELYLTAPRP
jgi:hypothetical protein